MFLRYEKRGNREYHQFVDTLAGAQGVMFLCPLCFAGNGGPEGTHIVICWFRDRGVPDDASPQPGWAVSGSSFADLTLQGSVLLSPPSCGWHGHITAGVFS